MDEVDPLIQSRLRDWQARRLAIKDQMQASPERTLEWSWLLDQMDEEHEQILQAARSGGPDDESREEAPAVRSTATLHADVPASRSTTDDVQAPPGSVVSRQLQLRLSLTAASASDLRKLLELAVHELDGKLVEPAGLGDLPGRREGHMAGSLGDYRFQLDIKGGEDE